MKQIKIKTIKGKIIIKTGLHIGTGNDAVQIGGIDSAIIKNPLSGEPYIPGSSLKGKMRSLMEWRLEKLQENGETHKCNDSNCPICKVFGCANSNDTKNSGRGPTRIIVRDAKLSNDSKNFSVITEEKAENNINRITAKATPRFIERVVPGVTFDFEIAYRIIDTGDEGKTDEELLDTVVLPALKMLENDYLGGGGSRGNGQIEFKELEYDDGTRIDLNSIKL